MKIEGDPELKSSGSFCLRHVDQNKPMELVPCKFAEVKIIVTGCLGILRSSTLSEIIVTTTASAPIDGIESISKLRIPARSDQRLQVLMDRNSDGRLSNTECDEPESLVEVSASLSLVRVKALQVLGRKSM